MKKYFCIFLLLIFSLDLFSQINLDQGLVFYTPFEGTPNDISSSGITGILNEALPTNDRFGNPNSAYAFDGNNDFINYGDVLDTVFTSNQFTISVWVNITEETLSGNNQQLFLAKYAYTVCSEEQRQFLFNIQPNATREPVFYWSNLTQTQRALIVSDYSNTNYLGWRNYVLVFQKPLVVNQPIDVARFYVNGKAMSSTQNSFGSNVVPDIEDGSAPLTIGSALTSAGNVCQQLASFSGIIDEVRIYDRALSDLEIDSLWKIQPKPSVSIDLVSDYSSVSTSSGNTIYELNCDGNITFERSVSGFPYNYSWNFGDGIVENHNALSVSHTYNQLGLYEVVVTASNDFGIQGHDTTFVLVKDGETPNASFIYSQTNAKVRFYNQSNPNNCSLYKYLWDFGDGTSYIGFFPFVKEYQQKGEYFVKLSVESLEGEVSEFTEKIVIETTSVSRENSNSFTIFPNPTSDKISLSLNHNSNNAFVKIYSLNGKLIDEKNINKSLFTFDMSKFEAGIYYMKVEMENAVEIRKFILK